MIEKEGIWIYVKYNENVSFLPNFSYTRFSVSEERLWKLMKHAKKDERANQVMLGSRKMYIYIENFKILTSSSWSSKFIALS